MKKRISEQKQSDIMDFNTTEIVDIIDRCFIENLSDCSMIKSIFVVGSMSRNDYVFQQNNDYDIRVLVTEVSEGILKKIDEVLTNCMNTIRNKFAELVVSYSCIIGPVRFYSNDSKSSLLIHCLVVTEDSLQNLPIMHRISYSKQYRLYGEDVLNRFKNLKLTLSGVLNDSEGICYCMQHLSTNEIEYLCWTKGIDGSFVLQNKIEKFTPESAYEFTRYSLRKCTDNLRDYIVQEERNNYLDELNNLEANEMPQMDYMEFTNYMDFYISNTINYLKRLYLIAKRLEGVYET